MEMTEVENGMQVRHTESGELFSVASAPFWFDGEPAVTLRDRKGSVRISRLSGLEAVIEMTEEKHK